MDLDVIINLVTGIGILVFGMLITFGFVGVGSYIYWFKYRRYKQYDVKIFEKDNFGNIVLSRDDGAIFTSNNNKRLWLRKANVSMCADNIPYVVCGKNKEIYMFKKGHKNYVFVSIRINDSGLKFNVGEEDVNWALISYHKTKMKFQDSIWLKIAPYGIVLVGILVTFAIFFMLIRQMDKLVEMAAIVKSGFESGIV